MSVVVEKDSLTKRDLVNLRKRLSVKEKWTFHNRYPKNINVFSINEKYGEIHIPIGSYRAVYEKFPYDLSDYPKISLDFKGELLTPETDPMQRNRDQVSLVKEVIEKLHHNHAVLISAFTGFGKTKTAIYMACLLGLKTIVICHNNILKIGWHDEFINTTLIPPKIQVLKGNVKVDPTADIYIVGVKKAIKYPPSEFIHIGLVIVDEIHLCIRSVLTDTLLRFQPHYLIGLSATPDRSDGLHNIFPLYFGEEYVVRKEVKPFTVFKYKTSYTFPEIRYNFVHGEEVLAWSSMITDLTNIEKRWKEIAEIALHHPNHKIIILCDRQTMAKNIYNHLLKADDSAELLIGGGKKGWDKTKRVLVAGVKKGGVGLDDPSLNMAIVAADMKDVRQCEGRIRQINNIVYVIIDDFQAFEKHWKIQEKWFHQRGATIHEVYSTEGVDKILSLQPPS